MTGAYHLERVNGQPAPYTWTVSNLKVTLETGLLVLSPKGEWSLATSGKQQVGTAAPYTVSEIVQGTWSASGATLTLLSYNPPTSLTVTVSGDALSYSEGGNSFVYRR